MANSTFSGPVRSQNGFQELVDGVWTPLGGGGGGGGGGSAIILPRPEGSDVLVEMTEPTAVGQIYNYSLGPKPASSPSGSYVRLYTPNYDTELTSFAGGMIFISSYNGNISQTYYGSGSPDTQILFAVSNADTALNLQVVYIGEDSNGYKMYSVSGLFVYYSGP
jgi:hypothetical protein